VIAECLCQSLADHLRRWHAGRDHAITKADMASFFSVTSREVERMVQDLRGQAVPIGSSAHGYFWCVDRVDFLVTLGHIKPRFQAMRTTVEGIERAMAHLPPTQGDLFSGAVRSISGAT